MNEIHTHYHHLKVAEDAGIEEIRAAFKRYFLKYHPSRHALNRKRAERVMQIVSEAYAILSDPVKRAGYDAWIAQTRQKAAQESSGSQVAGQGQIPDAVTIGRDIPSSDVSSAYFDRTIQHKKPPRWRLFMLVAVLLILAYPAWLVFDGGTYKSLLVDTVSSLSAEGYEFSFENKCRHPVTLAIRYHGQDDGWHIDGWWNVESGESFYLEDEKGKRLTSRNARWYYYARTTNDTNLEWKGKHRFTFDGTRLAMIEMEDVDGDSEWSTSCD